MTRKYALTILIILMLMLGVVALWLQLAIERTEAEQSELLRERDALAERVDALLERVDTLQQERDEVMRRLQQWLDTWEVDTLETTAYAPLDPQAVEGMCYQGNPSVTASGAQVVIGETVAAGPSIPFGTSVWIEGHGWRVVQDRGGRITDRHLDIAVWSKAEAMRWGRQTTKVVYQR